MKNYRKIKILIVLQRKYPEIDTETKESQKNTFNRKILDNFPLKISLNVTHVTVECSYFFRNFKNTENESDLYLQIAKFSDPTLYLQNDQYKISDRLIYNMYGFRGKNFFVLPRASISGSIVLTPPLWIIHHDP